MARSFDQLPVASLSDILRSNATFYPKREAVVCGEDRLTWEVLDRRVSQAANGLLLAGLAKGDKVAILTSNTTDMVEIILAINVYPRDIEEVAAQHPDVADVTVIGIPDPRWDEVPLTLIVPKPGATPDLDLIKQWINERVGKHQRVSGVRQRESFPRNALGKVLKKELRAEYGS